MRSVESFLSIGIPLITKILIICKRVQMPVVMQFEVPELDVLPTFGLHAKVNERFENLARFMGVIDAGITTTDMTDVENVYDNEIYPLMNSLLPLIKTSGITIAAQFVLNPGDHLCTTFINQSKAKKDYFNEVVSKMKPQEKFVGLVVTGETGSFNAEVTNSEGYSIAEVENIRRQVLLKTILEDELKKD